MIQTKLADFSLAELGDRLKARADDPKSKEDLDPFEVLAYLMELPESLYTSDSATASLQLFRVFVIASQENEALQAASLASRMATTVNDLALLSRARQHEGRALAKLGRFAQATVAQAEAWSIARELEDKTLELNAVWGFSTISVAIGQWSAAIGYCERMRAIAQQMGWTRTEFIARNNLADCALQLRDPVSALRVLSQLVVDAPNADIEPGTHAHLHNNLARASLLMGDLAAANFHAKKACEWAAKWGVSNVAHCVEAVKGLVNVRLGLVESGLSSVNLALNFAKRVNQVEVPDSLGICIDAYEAAGRLDEALVHLRELVEWKKKSVDAQIAEWQIDGMMEFSASQTSPVIYDEKLLAKMQSLHVGVQSRIERLLELALNAETAGGHDLYRIFRLGNLARFVAASLGRAPSDTASLVLGAQLCNVGMIAIPARILFKPERLSVGETQVLRGHTDYGAELLRKSKLQALELAAVIAEQHHERYDGNGYPRALGGQAIAEEARIVAVCDAFDAMTHRRPFRRTALSVEEALNALILGAGRQFDPSVVDVFVNFIQCEFYKHDDFDAFLAEGASEIEYVRVRARMEASI